MSSFAWVKRSIAQVLHREAGVLYRQAGVKCCTVEQRNGEAWFRNEKRWLSNAQSCEALGTVQLRLAKAMRSIEMRGRGFV